MKRICLTVVGLYVGLFGAFSQTTKNDSLYKKRKLRFEEAEFVSSYYKQDGNNSAVTGGIGTEQLTDYSNYFEVKFSRFDKHERKQTWNLNMGVDYYTSASSDKIDPSTISSASHEDLRVYPALSWNMENEKKRDNIGFGVSYSIESDYWSHGFNASYSKKTKDKSGEFTAKLQAYIDRVEMIPPVELRADPTKRRNFPTKHRNTYNGSFSYSQIINQRLQIMFLMDIVAQEGFMGLPFHRIYFQDNKVSVEKLPSTRYKLPLGFKANYFLGDRIVIRSYYRFYKDSWGLDAHTFNIETPIKISPFFSVSPYWRYYMQSGVDYFAPYKVHTQSEKYYTSNYDLSKFNSHFFGAGIRLTPVKGLLGIKAISLLELRYGHYTKNIGMNADVISMNLKFK